jgi:YqjK-like protein
MNKKTIELMERRNKLLARISAQREHVTEICIQLQSPLSLIDKGVAVARFLRFHPLLVAGAAVFMLIRRRSVAGFMWVGWSAWKVFRDFTSISVKLFSRD